MVQFPYVPYPFFFKLSLFGVDIYMITLMSGTPRSGKSLHAVYIALDDYLKIGKNVITNFPLDWHRKLKRIKGDYQYWKNEDITPRHLLEYAQEHHKQGTHVQTLVVIDEASIMFNARDFSRKDRIEWINFFANHGHFNFDFILIAQNDKMLDKQIRGLIEYDVKHRSLSNFNFLTLLISKIFGGLFLCISYWYPIHLCNGKSIIRFNRRKASCYDTMALFIDKSATTQATKSKSKVVIIDEQIADNDTQRKQDDKTTINIDCVSYDVNTGVSTVASDRTGGSNSRC